MISEPLLVFANGGIDWVVIFKSCGDSFIAEAPAGCTGRAPFAQAPGEFFLLREEVDGRISQRTKGLEAWGRG